MLFIVLTHVLVRHHKNNFRKTDNTMFTISLNLVKYLRALILVNPFVLNIDISYATISPSDSVPIVCSEKKACKAYIKRKALPIRSIESGDFSDLSFFKELLKNKRIVVLGESSHNIAEFNTLKIRLIKFLHEQMGFDVLATENGLSGMFLLNESKNFLTPDSMVKHSLCGVWQVKENIPLMEYVKKSDIITTGFDYQFMYRPANTFIYKYLGPLNSEMVNKTLALDSAYYFADKTNYNESLKKRKDSLESCYKQLNELIHQNEDKLRSNLSRDEYMTIKKELQNRLLFTSLVDTKEFTSEKRDEIMANNLVWLADTLYPDKKIILWAHNAHIYKTNPENASSEQRIMLAETPEKFKKESYIIGLYMYSGKTGLPGSRKNVSKVKPNTLEYWLHQSGYQTTFMDFSKETFNKDNCWMFKSIKTLNWGLPPSKERLIMKKIYDGVILLDHVTVSTPLSN